MREKRSGPAADRTAPVITTTTDRIATAWAFARFAAPFLVLYVGTIAWVLVAAGVIR